MAKELLHAVGIEVHLDQFAVGSFEAVVGDDDDDGVLEEVEGLSIGAVEVVEHEDDGVLHGQGRHEGPHGEGEPLDSDEGELGDGETDEFDLGLLLVNWGNDGLGDVNVDGQVDGGAALPVLEADVGPGGHELGDGLGGALLAIDDGDRRQHQPGEPADFSATGAQASSPPT